MKIHKIKGIRWTPRCVYPVHIGFTRSRKAVDLVAKSAGHEGHVIDEYSSGHMMFLECEGKAVFIVWIEEDIKLNPLGSSIVAHECLHVLQQIKRMIDEPDMSDEAEAYFLSWLVEIFLEFMEKK